MANEQHAEHIARFGSHGIWGLNQQFSADQVRRFEQIGVGAIWLGGSPENLDGVRAALAATATVTVATGIVNIWNTDATTIANEYLALEAEFPGRFYLGVGAGHPEANAGYEKPYDAVNRYLDALDAAGVPAQRRLLAALGPRMLRLSAQRSLGAAPYLTPPSHTRFARDTVGAGVLVAPEHKIVLNDDPVAARAVGRPVVDNPYLHLQNYRANLIRFGYPEAELNDGGSDRVIDDLVAHGDAASIRAAVDAHLAAGADHVGIQILGSKTPEDQLAQILAA